MLEVVGQPIAEMPVDLPVRVTCVTQREVVRPALQLPIQLFNQARHRRTALTAIRHFAEAILFPLYGFVRRPHV